MTTYLLRTALEQMSRYRAQSLLVVLGVGIGIANIILLLSMTDMGRRQTLGLIEDFGARVLIIVPYIDFSEGPLSVFSRANSGGYIPMNVYEAVSHSSAMAPDPDGPGLQVSAMLPLSATVSVSKHDWYTVVAGATPLVKRFGGFELARGRWFTQADLDKRAPVAVLGATAKAELFGQSAAVGREIRVKGQTLTVIGVLKPKRPTGFEEYDNRVFAPLTLIQQLFEFNGVQGMLTRYRQGLSADEAIAQVKRDIAAALGPQDAAEETVSIFTVKEATKLMDRTLGIFRSVLLGVASIALIVAGIGIMNVMLIRVLRRRMEIGLRRAVGATTRGIAAQFIVESAVQAVIGALFGVLVGCTGLLLFASYSEWQFYISPRTLALAIGFGALVGIVFGVYPAWAAARVDPIKSLRFEL